MAGATRAGRWCWPIATVALAACTPSATPTPSGVGIACAVDDDCARGLVCTTPSIAGVDGSARCTRACATDDDCPSSARCGPFSFMSDGSAEGACVPACDPRLDVRAQCLSGDICWFDGLCVPLGCTADADCGSGACDEATGICRSGGNPNARTGDRCTTSADCRAPAGLCSGGTCAHPSCDHGSAYACTLGEICVAVDPDLGLGDVLLFECRTPCTPGVDAVSASEGGACHAGEICVPPEADLLDEASTGHCTATDDGYPHPAAGARVGDACTSSAQCPGAFGYGNCISGRCSMEYCATSVFDGMTPCGADGACIHGNEPGATTRASEAHTRAGFCARICTGGATCPTGTTCDPMTGYCL